MPFSQAPVSGEDQVDRQEMPGPALDVEHSRAAEPDVYLDVPDVEVDELGVRADDLRAKVSMQAEILDMLRLNVGADVSVGRVELDLSGVRAQASLKVRLAEVAAIVDRVLTTLDRNPELAERLSRDVEAVLDDVSEAADQAADEVERPAVEAEREVRSAADDAGGASARRAVEQRRVRRDGASGTAPESPPEAEGIDVAGPAPKQPGRPVEPVEERGSTVRRRSAGGSAQARTAAGSARRPHRRA